MTEDGLIRKLRELPPELTHPSDRLEQVRRRARHRQGVIVGVAGASVALLVAVPYSLTAMNGTRNDTTPAAESADNCPSRYDGQAPWVPREPQGINGDASLVPNEAPRGAIVCAYSGQNTDAVQTGWQLSGRRTLTQGLDRLPALRWLPRLMSGQTRSCTDMGGRQTNYLLGLTYAGGTEWVSASADPNGCVGTSNGTFASATNIGNQVGASYQAGAWVDAAEPSRTDPNPCWRPRAGRLGQDTSLVPGDPVAVQVCEGRMTPSDFAYRTWTARSGFGDVLATLRAMSTKPTDASCQGDGRQSGFYSLLFTYSDGPPVSVRIDPHCTPGVSNGTLDAESASAVVTTITALIATLG